jgi:hypothetical protein
MSAGRVSRARGSTREVLRARLREEGGEDGAHWVGCPVIRAQFPRTALERRLVEHPPDGLPHRHGLRSTGTQVDTDAEIRTAGHRFTWKLTPTDDGRTEVTQTYDWSAVTHPAGVPHPPVVSADHLDASLTRLAAAAA